MLKVDAELRQAGATTRILLQVHDELLLEVPESELADVRSIVRRAMQEIHPLRVPLVVDQSDGKDWYEAK
jgi:DNA polymerase-1